MDTKVILISGGTNGIGKAITLLLMREGYKVATFSTDEKRCKDLTKALSVEYEQKDFLVFKGDVRNEKDIRRIVNETKKKFGRIDVLINNAGYGIFTAADKIDKKNFEDMIGVNIVGLAMLTKAVVPVMKKQRAGQIINIASIAGRSSTVKGEFYAATKFGVMGYSDGLRKELKDFGIKVATVCPGLVKTNFLTKREHARRMKEMWNGVEPHMLEPEDVARAVSFICGQSVRSDVQDILVMPF